MCSWTEVLGNPSAVAPPTNRPPPYPEPPVKPAVRAKPIRTPQELVQALHAHTSGKDLVQKIADQSKPIEQAQTAKREAGKALTEARERHEIFGLRYGTGSTPAQRRQLAVLQEQVTQARTANDAALAHLDQTRAKARQDAHALLKAKDPVQIKASTGSKLSAATEKTAKEGMGFVRRSLSRAGVPNDTLHLKLTELLPLEEQRAHYIEGKGVFLAENGETHTAVHEMGHAVELQLPGALDAAKAFLKHRVGNEPLRSMRDFGSSYRSDEFGRKDHFDRYFPESRAYYVGKHYRGEATEVISMGLEALYNDPVNFAKKDPEYAQFITGILDGSLRTAKP